MACFPRRHALAIALVFCGLGAVACAGVKSGVASPGAGGSASGQGGGGGASSGQGGAGGMSMPKAPPCPNDMCTDFPADPVVDPGVPPNPGDMFTGTPSGAAPCVTEPEDGALFPNNWLRPRVKWTGAGLTRITVSAPNQT